MYMNGYVVDVGGERMAGYVFMKNGIIFSQEGKRRMKFATMQDVLVVNEF